MFFSGVGLNLTRANNVISLDLGWSQAIEAQAFDRVHRLGQTRDVEVHRLVITNTVEDRVLEMQERKVCSLICSHTSGADLCYSKISLMAAWGRGKARRSAVSAHVNCLSEDI